MLFFPRDNLPAIKDGAYVKILMKDKGMHRISIFIIKHAAVYFDSFEIG